MYTVLMRENKEFDKIDLETAVNKLRNFELNMVRKETPTDQVQDPGMYGAKVTGSSSSRSESSAYYSKGEPNSSSDGHATLNMDGDICFVAGGSNSSKPQSSTGNFSTSASSMNYSNMPMSVKSAEQQFALYASFIASYENYIKGKIVDPVTLDEDFDQIDSDDLEEMDL